MPNALTMKPGAGRKASPPVRDRTQALPTTTNDAATAKFKDTLAGSERDVGGGARGPNWLRRRYPAKPAGGAARKAVF